VYGLNVLADQATILMNGTTAHGPSTCLDDERAEPSRVLSSDIDNGFSEFVVNLAASEASCP